MGCGGSSSTCSTDSRDRLPRALAFRTVPSGLLLQQPRLRQAGLLAPVEEGLVGGAIPGELDATIFKALQIPVESAPVMPEATQTRVAQAVQARSAARYTDFSMLAPGLSSAQCAG